LSEGGYIALKADSGNDSDPERVLAQIEDGKFYVSLDLTKLSTTAGWYNIRIYTDDVTSYRVQLKDTPYAVGKSFTAGGTTVTVRSWTEDEGSGARTIFSLDISK
jgi:hypothetical protein